jgi:hypothetical protein
MVFKEKMKSMEKNKSKIINLENDDLELIGDDISKVEMNDTNVHTSSSSSNIQFQTNFSSNSPTRSTNTTNNTHQNGNNLNSNGIKLNNYEGTPIKSQRQKKTNIEEINEQLIVYSTDEEPNNKKQINKTNKTNGIEKYMNVKHDNKPNPTTSKKLTKEEQVCFFCLKNK